jgi:hypothetical protein
VIDFTTSENTRYCQTRTARVSGTLIIATDRVTLPNRNYPSLRPERNALPVPQNFPTLAAWLLRSFPDRILVRNNWCDGLNPVPGNESRISNHNLATILKANYT